MPEVKVPAQASWWKDESESMDSESAEIAISFDSEAFYIDGLRDGHYLSIDLGDLAKAIVANSH
jgi:hypothetical protein